MEEEKLLFTGSSIKLSFVLTIHFELKSFQGYKKCNFYYAKAEKEVLENLEQELVK